MEGGAPQKSRTTQEIAGYSDEEVQMIKSMSAEGKGSDEIRKSLMEAANLDPNGDSTKYNSQWIMNIAEGR